MQGLVVQGLFDSHCHLDFAQFDHDREQVLAEAAHEGIESILIPGVSPEQWARTASLAHKLKHSSSQPLPKLYYAAGIHPWWVGSYLETVKANVCDETSARDETQALISHELSHENCVAIGECGLDKGIDTPLNEQERILEWHLQVAEETKRPLILHCRKAHNELLRYLQQGNFAGGVIHGFSGSIELAQRYWSLGFYLGIGGTITYPRANKTRLMVKDIPLEAILLETDAPDMPLCGRQGERNSPVCIAQIAKVLAELRGESVTHIAIQTRQNCRQLFGV